MAHAERNGSGGNTDEALRLIEGVEQSGAPADGLDFAWAYASVGRFDEAFEILDANYESGDPFLSAIRTTDNRWYVLRDDPRYEMLLQKMNLPINRSLLSAQK